MQCQAKQCQLAYGGLGEKLRSGRESQVRPFTNPLTSEAEFMIMARLRVLCRTAGYKKYKSLYITTKCAGITVYELLISMFG